MKKARYFLRLATMLVLLHAALPVPAHSPASSQVRVELVPDGNALLTVDIALTDVAQRVILDRDRDGAVTWSEVTRAGPQLESMVLDSLRLASAGRQCRLTTTDAMALVRYRDLPHISLRYRADCGIHSADYRIAFGLLFGIDPLHRVVVRIDSSRDRWLEVLTREQPELGFSTVRGSKGAGMLREGFAHILEGYDHLLFLLLLILPATAGGHWREKLLGLGAVVTAFTMAHSVTLALAATGTVSLPGKVVEVAIAVSIVVAGLVNLWRPAHTIGWRVAFAFGLIHGFGFAGALAEIGLEGGNLLLQLLAFNVGVELGQLTLVVLVLPLVALLASLPRYRRLVLPALSAGGATLGLVWAVTRV